jgi:hypothetical protein
MQCSAMQRSTAQYKSGVHIHTHSTPAFISVSISATAHRTAPQVMRGAEWRSLLTARRVTSARETRGVVGDVVVVVVV